jgi:hypothetical protein
MGRVQRPKGNEIHVLGKPSETFPCPYGEPLPDLPSNFLLVSQSGGGKTVVLLDLLLIRYRGMFERIWFFSPSIKLDPQYAPIRKHLESMTDQEKEPLMFEDLDQAALGRILADQRAIVEECRKRKQKPPSVAICLDDLADRGDLLAKRSGGGAGGSWMNTLFTRGRHMHISVFLTTQKLNLISTVIRCNVRCMCVWRLRNHKEIESLCEEMSGVYDAKTVLELYRRATEEPYSFLFIRLDAKTRQEVFYLRFEARLIPEDVEEQ